MKDTSSQKGSDEVPSEARENLPEEREQGASAPEKVRLLSRDLVTIALINLGVAIGFNMTLAGMPVYVSQIGASEVATGLVTTILTLAALLARPFAGIMMDRLGRKGIIIASTAVMSASIVGFAVFPLLGVILVLRLLQGFGFGLGSSAVATVAADVIPRKRFAEGMGYFSLTVSLSNAIAPALALALLDSGGIVAMVAVAAGCTFVSMILALTQRMPEAQDATEKMEIRASNLLEKKALLPAGVMLLLATGYSAIVTFIAIYAASKGIDNVYLYFIIYAITTLVCRPLVGMIIDRIGYFLPGIVSALGMVGTLVLISFAGDIYMLCIAGVLAGVGFGTGTGTMQTMAVAAVPSKRRGVATSTFYFGLDGGVAAGAVIAGAISGMMGYGSMYVAMIVFPILALGIFLVVGKKRVDTYSVSEEEEGSGTLE